MTFDPETDAPHSPQRVRISDAYETLRTRGNDERAEELREADSLRSQLSIVDDIPEFDPKHDTAYNSTRVRIKRVYDQLRAAGDDRAEELRDIDTVRDQHERASTLASQIEEGDA